MSRKRHIGKMLKSEEWVDQNVKTMSNARKCLQECEQHIRQCEYEKSQVEIRRRTWAKRANLIEAKMRAEGWSFDATQRANKKQKNDEMTSK